MYVLKLEQEQFEGPLDLLLTLIEKRQLDITRVSLARIAEDYVALMSAGQYASLEQMADFLSVASRLLLLKSKSLLPFLVLAEEEEEAVDDLEWRLKEYKRYKEAALLVKALWEGKQQSFSREKSVVVTQKTPDTFPETLSAALLSQVFARAVSAIQLPEVLEERVLEETISIEDRIVALRSWFADRIESSFAETVAEAESRTEVIVSFLAMLELVRQKILHADQEELFVDIRLRRRIE